MTRRSFCGCLLGSAPFLASAARAEPLECAVFTPERQAETSPADAIARLVEGNRRFVEGRTVNCDLIAQVRATSAHQAPIAAVVGCIDSRVPPELVFDQRIGDIFCARVAGNFVNADILGSLEYAVEVAGAKAIVVLGHSSCGAIKSAIAGVEMGNITGMLENIEPALSALDDADGPRDPADKHQVAKVAEANARLAVEAIAARSPILRELAETGQLRIVAAIHDVTTGEVAWLS